MHQDPAGALQDAGEVQQVPRHERGVPLDGADAARFLQDLKWVIENHDFRGELGL